MRKLFPIIIVAAGCGNVPGFGSPTVHHRGGDCTGGQEGIVSLAWTIRGAAPTAASCTGIDHLELDLTGNACDVSIAPIPCALDRFRYDHLPEGQTSVTLTAVDGSGNAVVAGSIGVDLEPTVPPSPAPIDLN